MPFLAKGFGNKTNIFLEDPAQGVSEKQINIYGRPTNATDQHCEHNLYNRRNRWW